MKIIIESLYSERTWELEGTPRQVEAQILLLFPWLRSLDPAHRGDLPALLEHVDSQQAFSVEIVTDVGDAGVA